MPGPKGPVPSRFWCGYHGEGWVVEDLDTADGSSRHLCVGADCVLVSVDHRLAPETKFPGPAPALAITAGFDPLRDEEIPTPDCCGTLPCLHKPPGMTG